MFQAMGFDETFDVDNEKLSQLYKDLQKRLHPDKYSQKSEVTYSYQICIYIICPTNFVQIYGL